MKKVLMTCIVSSTFLFMTSCGDSGSSDSYSNNDSYYEESSSQPYEISFRGRTIVVEPEYGGCNNCRCDQYAHYPGQTACVICEQFGCTTNKFGHRH